MKTIVERIEKVEDIYYSVEDFIQFKRIMARIKLAKLIGDNSIFWKSWISEENVQRLEREGYNVHEDISVHIWW